MCDLPSVVYLEAQLLLAAEAGRQKVMWSSTKNQTYCTLVEVEAALMQPSNHTLSSSFADIVVISQCSWRA
jgi:hypothetical protein